MRNKYMLDALRLTLCSLFTAVGTADYMGASHE